MLHQGLAFKGFAIEATDGRIGTVSDFLFDDASWKLRWLVVDTGTWLTDRKLLIPPSAIDKADTPAQTLLLKLTRAAVENSPAIETDEPVSSQMEEILYGYYTAEQRIDVGLDGAGRGAGQALHPGAAARPAANPAADPHLRSLAEVTGYNILASDGPMGHVESFLIDDESWDIRYLVADTRNWWFGRHTLLSPASVSDIIWSQRQICLNLTGYKIKGSPTWEPEGLLDRAYEAALQAYYEWPARFLPVRQNPEPAATSAKPVEAETVGGK